MRRYKTAPILKDFIMLFANQNNNNNDSRKEFICSFHARMQPMKALHTEEEVRTAVG